MTRSHDAPHRWAGVALVLVVCGLFAGMDTAIRQSTRVLPLLLTIGVRYAFQAALMAAWIAARHGARFGSAHPRLQLLRGALLLGCTGFTFVGLRYLPVAEYTAVAMLTPVGVVLASALLLRERISRLRWALVAGSWIGALIVIRPGSGLFGWAVVFPLLAVACYVAFQLVSSRLAGSEPMLTTQCWTGCVGLALLLPFVVADAGTLWPALRDAGAASWALMLLIASLGTFGHLLFLLAFRWAPASTVAPLTYVQMGWAALLGWIFFDHLPDAWAWLGMGIVAVCGAGTAWLNARAHASHDGHDAVRAPGRAPAGIPERTAQKAVP